MQFLVPSSALSEVPASSASSMAISETGFVESSLSWEITLFIKSTSFLYRLGDWYRGIIVTDFCRQYNYFKYNFLKLTFIQFSVLVITAKDLI